MTPSFTPKVRFDNMRERTSSILSGYEGELRADTIDDVVGVVHLAEEAARRGLWTAGYVSYECAPAFDSGLQVRERDDHSRAELPLAWFGLYRECATSSLRLPPGRRSIGPAPWESLLSKGEYLMKVQSILDDIGVGNVYQVNLTNVMVNADLRDFQSLYRQLLIAQQPAYGALIELDGAVVVSASPELFIEWDGSVLRSRPMKGTIRRGRWPQEDVELSRELVGSLKETAENIMIVDLIRNDMGKVASLGTVSVSTVRVLEAYPNVWQLVSEVECATREDARLVDIFTAMFPCGSVTGAPKQSAMKIIQGLEKRERGVYCGAVGLLRPTPKGVHVRFNVAIRTAMIDQRTGHARFGSGGGIVADSQPEREYREMVLKTDMLNSPSGRPFRLLETFRHSPGVVTDNLSRHLDRLRYSAQFFAFRVRPDLDSWVADRLTGLVSETRVRLLLSRSGRIEMQLSAAPEPRSTLVGLVIDDEPVSSQSIMLFHKTTQRAEYSRRRRRFPAADDVVMVNERGECTEVTTANIAARKGPTWFTPPISSGCLPGIERTRLIAHGVLVEATLRPDDLRSADELSVFNSLRGWRKAELIGNHS
jgi:para-aminobenzoate synthetase/4-amino-4-deoxychorismate lyase